MMLLALQLVAVAAVPLKVSRLFPCVAPKFDPAIVTDVPVGPDCGETLETVGAVPIPKAKLLLLGTPPTVTSTGPVVAPSGTGTTMLVALQLVGVATIPLKVKLLFPCVMPKFSPVTDTQVPRTPTDGFKLVMEGWLIFNTAEPQTDPAQALTVTEPPANPNALPELLKSFVGEATALLDELHRTEASV
jgi:hypothetical protein